VSKRSDEEEPMERRMRLTQYRIGGADDAPVASLDWEHLGCLVRREAMEAVAGTLQEWRWVLLGRVAGRESVRGKNGW